MLRQQGYSVPRVFELNRIEIRLVSPLLSWRKSMGDRLVMIMRENPPRYP